MADLWTTEALPGIRWEDVEPPDYGDEPDDPRLRDLRGQGLTPIQLHTIQDIAITGRWL